MSEQDLFDLPSERFEAMVLALWTAGRNTAEIAAQVGVPESKVANALPGILEARRRARLEAARKTMGRAEQRLGVSKVPA